jgi:hypothetical protein
MIGDELDSDVVVRYFRGKSILITGSTGFLGKGTYGTSPCMHELAQHSFQGSMSVQCIYASMADHLYISSVWVCCLLLLHSLFSSLHSNRSARGEDTEGSAGREEALPPRSSRR